MKKAANVWGNITEKLFNFRPALFAAISFCLGIAFGYYYLRYCLSPWYLLLFSPTAILTLALSSSWFSLYRRTLVLLLLVACFALGFTLFCHQAYTYADIPHVNGEVIVVGTVENRVRNGELSKLTLTDLTLGQEEVEGRLNAYLYLPNDVHLKLGDRVALTGEARTNVELVDKYGFRSSAITKRIRYELAGENIAVVGSSNDLLLAIRARMEEVTYASMDETPAALTMALLTGDVSGVDGELMDNMRYGGIAHIFAVSGLNVGALYGLCLFLFSKTALRRTPKAARFLLLVAILWFYSGLCCFSASVVRAALFCAVAYFAKLLGGRSDMLEGLGVAAICILVWSPAELLGVGFQLSFAACLGLFLLSKPIGQVWDEGYKAFRRRYPKRLSAEKQALVDEGEVLPKTVGEEVGAWCSALVSASLAAQITTLPVLLIRFGYVSGWSLLLNFLFVPFTDAIFTLLLLLVSLACVLPNFLGVYLLYVPSVVWSAATLLFQVADFSTFALRDVQLSWTICVCYYGGITFLSDKWNLTKGWKTLFALLLLGGCGVGTLLYNL